MKYDVLILGASYGSLFGTKVLMAGHRVVLVCTRSTAELINREGTVVRFPIKGRESLLDIASKQLPGALSATTPDEGEPGQFELVVLAMQEGRKVLILAPLVRGRKGQHAEALQAIRRAGLLRARIDGQVVEVGGDLKLARTKAHDIEAVIDQDADEAFACDPGELWHFIWAAGERTGPY